VLLKIVYLLTCRVLGLAVMVFRGDIAKDAELLVPRHEHAVLQWHARRVRYEPADRAWFAALARLMMVLREYEDFYNSHRAAPRPGPGRATSATAGWRHRLESFPGPAPRPCGWRHPRISPDGIGFRHPQHMNDTG
jgi:hypothetical protein